MSGEKKQKYYVLFFLQNSDPLFAIKILNPI